MVRLCVTWPFVSKARNVVRLLLELVLLLFFTTGLIQCANIEIMRQNNQDTIESSTDYFNISGWIGVGTIALFNLGCLVIVLVNFVQVCCKSHRDQIR